MFRLIWLHGERVAEIADLRNPDRRFLRSQDNNIGMRFSAYLSAGPTRVAWQSVTPDCGGQRFGIFEPPGGGAVAMQAIARHGEHFCGLLLPDAFRTGEKQGMGYSPLTTEPR